MAFLKYEKFEFVEDLIFSMLSEVGVRAEREAVADENLDAKLRGLGLKLCPILRFLKDDDVDLNRPDIYFEAF